MMFLQKGGQKSLTEPGPIMSQDLTGILLRFHLHKIAIIKNKAKAFLQMDLSEEATDVTRFFCLEDKRHLTEICSDLPLI